MMNFIITNYEYRSMLEEIGEDYLFIDVFIKTKNKEEASMPIMVDFEKLLAFIEIDNQPSFDYLNEIRSKIKGYGPKHNKTLQVIQEDGFDLEPFLVNYVNSKGEDFITQHFQWCENISKPEVIKESEKKYNSLKNIIDDTGMKEYTIKIQNFQNELDEAIHRMVVKHYPELFDMDEKCILAYKSELVNTTLNFTSSIDKILNSKY